MDQQKPENKAVVENQGKKKEEPSAENQESQPQQQGEEKKLSKQQLRKLEKKNQKEEKKNKQTQQQQQQSTQQSQQADQSAEFYGIQPLIQSQEQTNKKWTPVSAIDDKLKDQQILIRARVHNLRVKGNLAFLILREQISTIQAITQKSELISKQMLKFIEKINLESIVDVYGKVTIPPEPIQSCTQKVELKVEKIYVISMAKSVLPFQIDDASRRVEYNEEDEKDQGDEEEVKKEEEGNKEEKQPSEQKKEKETTEKKQVIVQMKTRLDNRILDLRTQAKLAIFKVSSGVCQLFREYLYSKNFIEIHTPKLIGGTSEGGANVFCLKYFNKDACLAQSPQLCKQMAIMSDFDRVFEVGPVFRAENAFTPRHMCEFTGLDLEMAIKEHYFELLDLMSELFAFIFNGLETRYKKELEAIQQQFPFEPFKFKTPALKLTYKEGCEMLKAEGKIQDPTEDISTENEKALGAIVKKKYDTDFYMLVEYPVKARPFYTMPSPKDKNYTLSYDFFMRGQEITSGAQRIHDVNLLEQRAKECGISVDTIRSYLDSFRYGAYPHGGCGIGLERVVFLYCNMHNIRNTSMFPRDPKRIKP